MHDSPSEIRNHGPLPSPPIPKPEGFLLSEVSSPPPPTAFPSKAITIDDAETSTELEAIVAGAFDWKPSPRKLPGRRLPGWEELEDATEEGRGWRVKGMG